LAKKSLGLNPKESLAMLVLIDVEFRQGHYRGAIELADRYQEPIGGWAKSRLYRTRALSYSALKQFDRAIADGQRALELNPADPENYCALMGFYAAVEDDRILEILDAAKELFPWEDCVKEIDRILNQAGWI
jgi:tetratricopeptide (TPR) repeat protein